MTDVWTSERIEKLRKMYADGDTFSEIAAALGGGISRNSAIGKAHRLGLNGNKYISRPKVAREKRPSAQGVGAAVQKINMAKAAPPKIKPEPFVIQCAEVEPLGIGLMDLTDKTCRYPSGDGVITFCGHQVRSGPYCPAHRRIATAPKHERRGGVPHPAELGKARGGIFGRSA